MNLHCESHGSGPTLVFLHGLFGSGENLRTLGREFESDHTVLYPDLPNHGKSPHTDTTDFAQMSAAVASLLDDQGVSKSVVAGHSMGGKVAMRLALDRPDLTRGLVALDIAPRRYEPSHTRIIDAMLALPVGEVESRADADRRLAPAIPSRAVRAFLLKNLVKDDDSYHWRLNLRVLKDDYDSILGWDGSGSFDGPTLFVGGTDSKYLDPERDADLVHSHFPQARIEMLDGAGHWIHSERPDAVQSLVQDFLRRVPGDSS